ncbi:hypothetical protein [Chryseobacterium culicis]|uniref:hypothetical protein n=1 Tax=Chryseobacterium culicis TaxID=680127 RepID=UPI0018746108|nr:hypothetical protein [Chryseobacterium culicis]MBE4949921.1 hypothetical protein [Chryseobacterium culicis]
MESKEILKNLGMFIAVEVIIYFLFSFFWLDINPKTWSLESRALFASLSAGVLLMFGVSKILDN